jgi:hypothetical protein
LKDGTNEKPGADARGAQSGSWDKILRIGETFDLTNGTGQFNARNLNRKGKERKGKERNKT